MATMKDEVRRILDSLPDDANFEDVQYSLSVQERIERGLREGREGQVIELEEAEAQMDRWLDE